MSFEKVDTFDQRLTSLAPKSEPLAPSHHPGTFKNVSLNGVKETNLLCDPPLIVAQRFVMSVKQTQSAAAFRKVDTFAQRLISVAPKWELVAPTCQPGTSKNLGLNTSIKKEFWD